MHKDEGIEMHYLQSFRLWIVVVTNTTCLLSHNEIAAIVKGVIGRSTQEKMLNAPAMKFFVDKNIHVVKIYM